MQSKEIQIETDYIKEGSTTAAEPSMPPDPHEIEVEKYGDGKPKRIVIRARITHGNKG